MPGLDVDEPPPRSAAQKPNVDDGRFFQPSAGTAADIEHAPEAMDDDDIMSGRIAHPDALPPMRPFQVKVFVCSTPTDMEEERSAVVCDIVPKLSAYAREKYGLEFHYVDLRWGNRHTEADDYDTREFFMKELLRCQTLSAGLNFVAFVGQKYGRRRPPLLVAGEAFETVRRTLHEHRGRGARGASLLDKWYRRDANSVPPLYVLQHPSHGSSAAACRPGAQPSQGDSSEDEPLSTAAREIVGVGNRSEELELEKLMQVMQYGVKLCCEEGSLPPTAMRDYFTSDFEKELKQGTATEHGNEGAAIAVVRTIEDLLNYVSERRAATFTDVEWDEDGQRWRQSADCAALLASLVDRAVRRGLPASAVHDFGILWRYDSGVHPVLHRPYIADLCNTFHKSLLAAIDSAAAATGIGGGSSTDFAGERRLCAEVLAHWRHAASLGRHCIGREALLATVVNYVTSREPNAEPLVIYGEPGVGKTTIMAALALELQKLPLADAIIVPRFVGLSRSSAHLLPLLYGVCQQIRRALRHPGQQQQQQHPLAVSTFFDDSGDIPMGGDWSRLAEHLHELLCSTAQRTVILLLDGVDHLSRDGTAAAARMRWLPRLLGPNARVIVSVSSGTSSDALGRLRNELLRRRDSFLEVRPPPTAEACLDWISVALGGLHLAPSQRSALLATLDCRPTPLHARLLLAEAARWRSFDECVLPPAATAATAAAGYVVWLFDRLERRHGRVVVARALSYLTASEYGLSDLEMDELLSADDAVCSAVAFVTDFSGGTEGGSSFSSPSSASAPAPAGGRQFRQRRRLPPCIWARLRDDLDAHLSLRELDQLNVYCWSHACLADGAHRRYLADPAVARAVHTAMADHYMERWLRQRSSAAAAATAIDHARRSSVNGHGSSRGRLLASREAAATATAAAAASAVRPSARVYERLPAHLRGAERLNELAAAIVFNYEWLHSKARDVSLLAAVCDVRLLVGGVASRRPDGDARLLEKALSGAAKRLLAAGASGADGLAPELVGRLLPHARRHPSTIGRLVEQCESLGAAAHCALVPAFSYPSAPGSRLRVTMECGGDGDDGGPLSMWAIGRSGGSAQLLAKMPSSPAARLFDAASGQLLRTVATSVGHLYVPTPSHPSPLRNGSDAADDGNDDDNSTDDDPRFVVVVDDEADRSLKVHDSSSGAFLGQFIPGNHCGCDGNEQSPKRLTTIATTSASSSSAAPAVSRPQQRIDAVCITLRHACLVVGGGADAGSSCYLCVCTLPTCQPLKAARLDGRANVARAAPNGRYVLCSSGAAVVAFRLSTAGGGACERVDTTPIDGRPLCIAIAASSATAFAASSGGGGGCVVTVMHVSPASGRAQMVTRIALRDRLGGGGGVADVDGDSGGVSKLVPSNSDGLLAVVGTRAVLVYSTALDKLAFVIRRPASTPAEFRLPGHPFAAPVRFADVAFTPDDRHVACAILREVQLWSVRRGVVMRVLRGPTISFVERLVAVGGAAPLVATAFDGSRCIEVWDIGDGDGGAGEDGEVLSDAEQGEVGEDGSEVQPADRLSGQISRLHLSPDGALCFAIRNGCDEVGVFDAGSGRLRHLLTHEGAAVTDVVTSADGAYALVSLAPSAGQRGRRLATRRRRQPSPPPQGHSAVLWHVERRRELKRLGAAPGVGVALTTRCAFVHFAPRSPDFQAPYSITQLTVIEGDAAAVRETEAPFALSHVVGTPFVTADDKYLVALTAERYDEREAHYIRPSLLAFELHAASGGGGGTASLPCRLYGERELGYFASDERTILEARPIRHVSDQAVAIYALRVGDAGGVIARSLGFFVLDLHRGAVLRCSDSLGSPEVNTAIVPDDMHFSAGGGSGGLCLDARRGVAYSTVTGEPLAIVGNAGSSVRLACDGGAAVYCRRRDGCGNDEVVAERLRDGRVIARCPVDGVVTCMEVGQDEQTVVLGCADGGVLAYALVDDAYSDAAATLAAVRNRRRRSGRADADDRDDAAAAAESPLRWDRVVPPPRSSSEEGASGRVAVAATLPPPLVRSRSTSAAYSTPPDRERLTALSGVTTAGQSGRPRTSNGYATNGERGGGGGGVVVGIGGYTTLDRAVLLSRASSKACLLM